MLGDDRVHREVLSWVKEWDACVFGKGKARGKKRARGDEDGENLDEWRRPKEKVSERMVRTCTRTNIGVIVVIAVRPAWSRQDYPGAYSGKPRWVRCLRDQC